MVVDYSTSYSAFSWEMGNCNISANEKAYWLLRLKFRDVYRWTDCTGDTQEIFQTVFKWFGIDAGDGSNWEYDPNVDYIFIAYTINNEHTRITTLAAQCWQDDVLDDLKRGDINGELNHIYRLHDIKPWLLYSDKKPPLKP